MRVMPLALALIFGGSVVAQADDPAGIVAHHGKIYETKDAGLATQGFIEIDNGQKIADALTGVTCAISGSTSLVGAGGNAISNLAIAPRTKLRLDANGPHILLQDTHFSIVEGGAIPCSLTFQNAGEISVYLYPVPAP